MTPVIVGGIYLETNKYLVLKVVVLETGKIGKRKDMIKFDMGQIVMVIRLGLNISKTAVVTRKQGTMVNW